MKDSLFIVIVAAILLAVGGFFAWQHIARLGAQIDDLSSQVESLGERAAAAEDRATKAEARAEGAEHAAGEAASRAEEAAVREQQSAELAEKAETARTEAEEKEARATAEREAAERRARESEFARKSAEEARLAAEEEREAVARKKAEAEAEAEAARAEARRAEAEKEKIQRRLEQELDRLQGALGRIADTRRTALGLVMTLDSKQIEFDFDKAELRPRNRELLSRIAGVLLTFDNYGIQIFGHTDDVGTEEYNKELSERRAQAVRDYLVEAGIDAEVMSTMGLGKSEPLVEGTDPESRQRNRRVELAIVFSEGEYGKAIEEQAE